MIEILLPEEPAIHGEMLPIVLRWSELFDPAAIEVKLSWHFQCPGAKRHAVVAAEEFAWPGREGEERLAWRLPLGPVSFAGLKSTLSYELEVRMKPGKVKEIRKIRTAAPGCPGPFLLEKAEPPVIRLPALNRFMLKQG